MFLFDDILQPQDLTLKQRPSWDPKPKYPSLETYLHMPRPSRCRQLHRAPSPLPHLQTLSPYISAVPHHRASLRQLYVR
jgi:hypothetical protein